MALQAIRHTSVIGGMGRSGIHDDDVESTQQVFMVSEGFANQPLDAIAAGRETTVLFCDRQAEARWPVALAPIQDGK